MATPKHRTTRTPGVCACGAKFTTFGRPNQRRLEHHIRLLTDQDFASAERKLFRLAQDLAPEKDLVKAAHDLGRLAAA